MVVTERHLWVNLADLEKKEKGFFLDVPISPSQLFSTSVETVVEKLREARARSAAFKIFIPWRSRSEPEQSGGPGPSWSKDWRRAQKASVTTRAPSPPAGRGRGRYCSKRGKRRDLREVIQTKHSQKGSRLDHSKKNNIYSLPSGGFYHRPLTSLPNSPANHHLPHRTEVRWEPKTAARLDLWWFQTGSIFFELPYWWSGHEFTSEVSAGTSLIFSYSGHHCKGRASITSLTLRGLPMSMPLPSERLNVLSFWGMSFPLSRAHCW